MATCAFVVGNSGSLTTGDNVIKGRITGLGYTVTIVDDSDAAELTKDFVVIAESVTSANVLTKYRTFGGGVMTMESGLTFDNDLATTDGATGVGTTTVQTGPDPGAGSPYTPLWAGLGFNSTPTIAGSNINPTGNVTADFSTGVVVGLKPLSVRPIVAWDKGATMENGHGAAEGRRVFFGLGDDGTYANLNANGLALLDAAITWVAPSAFSPLDLGVSEVRHGSV